MSPFIKNTQHIRIERREWYDYLQHDISPLFKPDSTPEAKEAANEKRLDAGRDLEWKIPTGGAVVVTVGGCSD